MMFEPVDDEYAARLSAYLDDDLAQDERASVASHLASCAQCARTLSELEGVVSQLRAEQSRGVDALPHDAWPRIQHHLHPVTYTASRSEASIGGVLLRRALWAAAMLALGLLTGLWIATRARSPEAPGWMRKIVPVGVTSPMHVPGDLS